MDEKCENCYAFHSDPHLNSDGECRLQPPSAFHGPDCVDTFPRVKADYSCQCFRVDPPTPEPPA